MKIKLVLIFALALFILACENQEFEVEDFGTTAVYFPFQRPVRTIIQGDYDLGFNDNDNLGKFQIGVRMSGVFSNTKNRRIHFRLAPELIDPVALGVNSVNVRILPSNYYTIEQSSPLTIPAGSTDGRITIQLQQPFFDDPLSFADFEKVNYVIPLEITRIEELDSLLTGVPIVANPIKVKDDDWNPAPKDYTLFGIKFINPYHGQYLRRGADRIVGTSETFRASTGQTQTVNIDTTSVYRAQYVERDEVTLVSTSGRSSVNYTNRVRRGKIPSQDNVTLRLTIDDSGNITINNIPGQSFTVTGTGKFINDGDKWGGKNRDVLHLQYTYKDVQVVEEFFFGRLVSRSTLDLTHTVNDTLVIRNRDVKFEQFTIELN